MTPTQPRTMPHEFTNPVLKKHFLKSPIPAGAIRLIDIPPDVFLDTEEEVNVIAASLWIMSILYDKLPEKEVPKTKEDLRKWVTRTRIPVIAKMADKVEPPFMAWSMDQMQRDVFAMMEELLLPSLPPEDKSVSGPIKK